MASGDLTKRLYCETLLRMCETRKLSTITTSAIIAEAKTARQTFYNYFSDINDLISYIPINFMDTYERPYYFAETVREAYRYAQQYKGFFCQLPFLKGQNNFRDTFIAHFRELLHAEFLTKDLSERERIYRYIAIEQVIVGTTDTFLEWCKHDMSWPLEILVRVHFEAAPPFMRETQRATLSQPH